MGAMPLGACQCDAQLRGAAVAAVGVALFHLSILHLRANGVGDVFIDLDIKPADAELADSRAFSVMRGFAAVLSLFEHERQIAHALGQNRLDVFPAVAPNIDDPIPKAAAILHLLRQAFAFCGKDFYP